MAKVPEQKLPKVAIPVKYALMSREGTALGGKARRAENYRTSLEVERLLPQKAGETMPHDAIIPFIVDARYSFVPATNITPTVSEIVVEHGELRLGTVTLQGEIGPLNVRNWEKRHFITHPSVVYLQKALDMLRQEMVNKSKTPVLTLVCIDEGMALRVVPTQIALPRTQQNRLGISFSMGFQIVGFDAFEVHLDYSEKRPSRGLGAKIFDAMNKVQGALDKAQSFVDLAKRWQGKIYAGIAQLKGMLDQVNNMARYVVSAPMQLAQMAKAINNVAFTTWQQWKDIGKLAQRAWGSGDFWKHGWGWEATDAELLPQKPTHEDAGARTKLRVVQSILNAIAEQRRTLNNAALEAQRPFGIHIVSSGESLESIAIRYFGSLDGVSQLLSLNPNLKALPLRPGMQIKVPKSAEAMWQSRRDFPVTDKGYNAPSGDEDGRAGDAWFGEDLLGPDLKLAGEEGGICDLATIKGTDLVMQDCLIRLMTHKGTNVLYPQVGLSVSPGDLNDTTAVSMAVAEVWQNLVCDDRIAGVRSLDVVDNGNGITIEATVALVDRKEIGLQWRGT